MAQREIFFDIDGDEALLANLNQLPIELQKKVLPAAISKSITPLVRAVRKATPVGPTGNLKKSTKKIIRKRTKRGVVGLVGHAWPSGAHAHLVARGTKPRQQKTTGRKTGIMPANDYMTRATSSVMGTVEANLKMNINLGIIAALEKRGVRIAPGDE